MNILSPIFVNLPESSVINNDHVSVTDSLLPLSWTVICLEDLLHVDRAWGIEWATQFTGFPEQRNWLRQKAGWFYWK